MAACLLTGRQIELEQTLFADGYFSKMVDSGPKGNWRSVTRLALTTGTRTETELAGDEDSRVT